MKWKQGNFERSGAMRPPKLKHLGNWHYAGNTRPDAALHTDLLLHSCFEGNFGAVLTIDL